jgi:membrane complex biogenesis BtpA family protein
MRNDRHVSGKLALAMVQLRPLPGSYRYRGESLGSIIEAAVNEAAILEDAGFDGLQLQNMGDNPSTRKVAIRQAFPRLSLSVMVNWDAEASIAVADAAGADFIRIEHTFTGVAVTAWGLSEACCYAVTRFHRHIGARMPIYADVYEPHAVPLGPMPIDQAARMAVDEGGADGLFITGRNFEESMSWLQQVRQTLPTTPLILGGGATPENVARALSIADGVVVATWIKGGNMRNLVEPELARRFTSAVSSAREN